MNRLWSLACVSTILAIPVAALSNAIPRWTLDELSGHSNIVVVGTATKNTYVRNRGIPEGKYSTFKVGTKLKGIASTEIEVWTRTGISETDVNCCDVGDIYILFLKPVKNGRFQSVDGSFGFIRLRP